MIDIRRFDSAKQFAFSHVHARVFFCCRPRNVMQKWPKLSVARSWRETHEFTTGRFVITDSRKSTPRGVATFSYDPGEIERYAIHLIREQINQASDTSVPRDDGSLNATLTKFRSKSGEKNATRF